MMAAETEKLEPAGPHDVSNLPVDSIVTNSIDQSPRHVSLRADMTACWLIPGGDLSLSLLSFEGRTAELVSKVVEADGVKGQRPTNMHGGPHLLEWVPFVSGLPLQCKPQSKFFALCAKRTFSLQIRWRMRSMLSRSRFSAKSGSECGNAPPLSDSSHRRLACD